MSGGGPAVPGFWTAGITYRFQSPEGLPVAGLDKAYESFTGPTGGAVGDGLPLDIILKAEAAPDVMDLQCVFASESWCMYRRDDVRCVVSPGEGAPGSLWTAQWGKGVSPVTVWPGSRLQTHRRRDGCIRNPLSYPLDQLLMMYFLASRGGVLIHGAGAVIEGGGYVSAGTSGAGKSTFAEILRDEGLGPDLLSDDRVVIRRIGDAFHVFGTPWAGTAKVAQNRGAPLKGLFFLSKDCENRVEVLEGAEVLPQLLRVASIPWYDRDVIGPVLETCEGVLRETTVGILKFRPDAGAAEAIVRFAELVANARPESNPS